MKEQTDSVYSRHLQRHIQLTVISTRIPDDKSDMNLLLFNNAADLDQIAAKKIIDSLYSKKLIEPLVLTGIHANEQEDFGMSGVAVPATGAGATAGKYNSFVMNELYPFIQKKTSIKKFKSTAIFGNSLAGISAFDIAWQNADKIDRVGIFSGDFNYAGNDTGNEDTLNAVFKALISSRKRPKLQYYLYAGCKDDTTIANNTKEFIAILHQKNTSYEPDLQFLCDKNGGNNINSWRNHFAAFLVWAFGK